MDPIYGLLALAVIAAGVIFWRLRSKINAAETRRAPPVKARKKAPAKRKAVRK